jgi:hypothetical protein
VLGPTLNMVKLFRALRTLHFIIWDIYLLQQSMNACLHVVCNTCTDRFHVQKFYVLPIQCIYVFCVDLRTNSDYFTVQH